MDNQIQHAGPLERVLVVKATKAETVVAAAQRMAPAAVAERRGQAVTGLIPVGEVVAQVAQIHSTESLWYMRAAAAVQDTTPVRRRAEELEAVELATRT